MNSVNGSAYQSSKPRKLFSLIDIHGRQLLGPRARGPYDRYWGAQPTSL